MCLVLIFCVVSRPIVEVDAVAGAITGALLYIGASIAAYLGFTFATNEDAQKALSDWFWSTTDKIRNYLNYAAGFWTSNYNVVHEWGGSTFYEICQSMADYFQAPAEETSTFLNVTPMNDDNILGWTSDTQWSIVVPVHDYNCRMTADLGKSTLTIGDQLDTAETIRNYSGSVDKSTYDVVTTKTGLFCRFYSLKSKSSGLEWYFIDWNYNSFNWKEPIIACGSYIPGELDYSQDFNDTVGYKLVSSDGIGTFKSFSLFYNNTSSAVYPYRDSDGNYYVIQQLDNGKYAFVCSDSSLPNFYDKEFDSYHDALCYFASECGITLPNSNYEAGAYVPGDTSKDYTVDKERLNQKLDEVGQIKDSDGTISTVLPGSQAVLDEMEANPDLVTDVEAEWVYDAEIPAIQSDPLLWQTKFPFCLPFDLFNLFTGFTVEAEAPVWHLLVIPENSFGLENEAIYFDIDFGANGLDIFVKYLRFFIGASFVVFLILISRKLIGAE